MKLMKKHGLKKAALAVGRKLSVIMHKMLITGEVFRYGESGCEDKTGIAINKVTGELALA